MAYIQIMDGATRTYRKRKRAELEKETRLRITRAAVELHGTVGPANTTVTDLAKRAGVSRMTVYNHFPTEVELFTACSSHWAEKSPFPDPSRWTAEDPSERVAVALSELYGWYRRERRMLGNVIRDTPLLPSLAEVMHALWDPYMKEVVDALASGWPRLGASAERRLLVMLRLAVDFHTWEVLTGSGLSDAEAVEVMAGVLLCDER